MPRNGSGTYNRLSNPAYTNGTANDGTEVENEMNDIATALTGSLAANGEKQPTADQPMGGFKHTAVAAGAQLNQYARVQEVQTNELSFGVTTGGTLAYLVTLPISPALTTFPDGMTIRVRANATNTGAMTLAVNGTPPLAVQLNGAAVPVGVFVIDRHYDLIYRLSTTTWHIMAMMDAPGLNANNTFSGVNQFSNVKNAMSSDVAAYAWAGSETRAMDFGALGIGAVLTSPNVTGTAHNAYTGDGGVTFKRKVAGFASLIYTRNSDGNVIILMPSVSGVADSAIGWANYFEISAASGAISSNNYTPTAVGHLTPMSYVDTQISAGDAATLVSALSADNAKPTVTIITAAGAGTYTTPSGATKLVVKGLGGGGGGGGGRGGAGGGGGGSAGAMDELLMLSPASSYPYVVGPGGAGGPANTDGSNGTATSFNGISLGKGGLGGKEGATRTGGASVTGGKLGGASGGGTATAGGSPSLDSSGAGGDGAGAGQSGGGGSSLLAPGANGVAGGVIGNPGTLGSGGSGGGAGGVQTGGPGGDGVLIVEAYFN